MVSGCAGSVAGIAGLSQLITGRAFDEALGIDTEQLFDYLGGVPGAKRHGLDLALEAFRSALHQVS